MGILLWGTLTGDTIADDVRRQYAFSEAVPLNPFTDYDISQPSAIFYGGIQGTRIDTGTASFGRPRGGQQCIGRSGGISGIRLAGLQRFSATHIFSISGIREGF